MFTLTAKAAWLTITTFLFGAAYADEQAIEVNIYAMQDSPPYSFLENEALSGIYTDIIRHATDTMQGYKINIFAVPFRRGLSFMQTGDGFAIYPPYYRPDSRPYIHPYSVPILTEQITVFCQKKIFKNNKRLSWPEDYYRLRMATNSGYTMGGQSFWQAVKAGKIPIQQSESHLRSVRLLAMNRVDCYLSDKLAFQWALRQVKESEDAEQLNFDLLQGPVISQEHGYLAFSAVEAKYPFKHDFIEQFNQAIENMQRTGQIDNIVKSYTE